jgi:hypothetical protein
VIALVGTLLAFGRLRNRREAHHPPTAAVAPSVRWVD